MSWDVAVGAAGSVLKKMLDQASPTTMFETALHTMSDEIVAGYRGTYDWTMLHFAADRARADVLALLVKLGGAPLDHKGMRGVTPLHSAGEANN